MGYVALAAQVAGQIFSFRQQEKQVAKMAEAIRQQAGNALMQMNREFMNMEIERKDNFEQITNELLNLDRSSMPLISGVESAVNEEYGDGGNTGRLINRSARADVLNTKTSLKDNLKRKSEEIDMNKEVQWISTKNYIDSLKMPKLPSRTAALLGIAGTIVTGVGHIKSQQAFAKANGMKYNRWTGHMSTNGRALYNNNNNNNQQGGNSLFRYGGLNTQPTFTVSGGYGAGDALSYVANIFSRRNEPDPVSPYGNYMIRSRYGYQY